MKVSLAKIKAESAARASVVVVRLTGSLQINLEEVCNPSTVQCSDNLAMHDCRSVLASQNGC